MSPNQVGKYLNWLIMRIHKLLLLVVLDLLFIFIYYPIILTGY